jgi:hypothetical protein
MTGHQWSSFFDQGFNNLTTTIHTRASFTNILAGATRDGFFGGAGTAESFRKLTGVNGDMDFVLKIGRKISHSIIIFLINYISWKKIGVPQDSPLVDKT